VSNQPPRRYTGLIVIAVVTGVVAILIPIALGMIAKRVGDQTDQTAATQPPTQPTVTTRPSGPVPCRSNSRAMCFPKATPAGVSAILESRGATCRQDGSWTIICHQGSDPSIELYLGSTPGHPDKLEQVSATTRSAAAGGRLLVMKNLLAWEPTILSALLPGETGTQQQIARWLPSDFAQCPSGDNLVGDYRVRCRIPSLKDESGRVSTTWTTDLTIYPEW
jgi:hypothetical protein